MLIKKEKKGDITIYYVKKDISDEKMVTYKNKHVSPTQIKLIINDDTDVYTEDNNLLLRFRKNKS
jgi:hypothetical protein